MERLVLAAVGLPAVALFVVTAVVLARSPAGTGVFASPAASPVGSPASTAAPTVTFRTTDLGTLGGQFATAYGVDAAGRVVGESSPTSGDSHAFLWDGGAMTDLGTLAGDFSRAEAINDAGLVVGVSTTAPDQNRFTPGLHAVLWDGGTVADLGTLGGDASWALDVNNRSAIVGISTTAPNQFLFDVVGVRAFLKEGRTMRTLGTLGGDFSRAEAINDAGLVVGVSTTTTDELRAVLWDRGTPTDLGTLGGGSSWAFDVNARGQVVGAAETATGELHAFQWEAGAMTDLGTLGGEESWAYAVNDAGQVVGESRTTRQGDGRPHAFLWEAGTMRDLGTLPGGDRSVAQAINEAGLVAGGSDTGGVDYDAVLWNTADRVAVTPTPMPTPTPTPTPVDAVLAGRAVVWVEPVPCDPPPCAAGSGPPVAASGVLIDIGGRSLVLTSAQLLSEGEDAAAWALVAAAERPGDPPQARFYARTVASDPSLGLALLEPALTPAGEPVRSADLQLPALRTGQPGEVEIEQPLTLVGYVAEGGAPRLVTAAVKVVGFEPDARVPELGVVAWIRTEASAPDLGPGAAALDEAGDVVGVVLLGDGHDLDCYDADSNGTVEPFTECRTPAGGSEYVRPAPEALELLIGGAVPSPTPA